MDQNSNYNSQIKKSLAIISVIINGAMILILLSDLFFHPQLQVTAQNNTSELQNSSGYIYLPIVQRTFKAYYVSPNGKDNNPGTLNLPFRTIGRAASISAAGDFIFIRNGIYTESVDFHNSGTATNPIVIKPYPGEYPVIDGGYSNNIGILVNILGNYINFSGIELRYSSGWGIYVGGSYDIVDNVFVHDTKSAGIMISAGNHSIVQNSRVWRAALDNENGAMSSGWGTGISAARNGVAYATIRHNTVWEVWGEGISTFEADHITIEGNISHDNWSNNIYISDATNVLCQGNFIYMNPSSSMYGHGNNNGLVMGDETYNPPSAYITIINNIAFGNHINFYWWDGVQGGGMNNVLIANNTFVNSSATSGIKILKGAHQNVQFRNNIIQQDGQLPIAIIESGISGITFSNNLWTKTPPSEASGAGDIIGNPVFEGIGDQFSPIWFKLTDFSPAKNRALTLPAVIVDYFGNTREATPDIGADEFFPPP